MSDKLDFSDLPLIKAGNETTLAEAGVPVDTAPAPAEPILDEQQLADLGTEMELEAKYGDSPLITSALSAADMAGFSVPGRVLDATGLLSAEDQKEYQKRNPEADIAGSIAGAVVPALVGSPTGIAGAIAKGASAPIRAGLATEKLAAKTLAKIVADTGTKKVAPQIIKKAVEKGLTGAVLSKAAGGAVEGGLYGLSQLLREEALGDAELNADNLLATVGTGALFGGLVGGAIPVAGSAISSGAGKISSTARPLFDKVISKYADPVKAAEELTGFTNTKIAKLNSNPGGQKLLEELPEWYTTTVKVGVGDTAEEILEKVKLTKQEAGVGINQTLSEIDKIAATRIAQLPEGGKLRAQLLNDLADKIDRDFYAPYKDFKSLGAQNRKVRLLLDDLRREAADPKMLTGEALVALKRKVDKVANSFYERAPGAKPTVSELAAFKARTLLNDASLQYARYVSPELAEQLAAQNRSFHYATTVEPFLLKKAAKDPSLLGFKDALYGLAGIGVGGGPLGAGVVLGKKFLESDLRRKLLILGGMERANLAVGEKISKSIGTFINEASRPARIVSTSALISSALAMKREDGKKPEAPKNKLEAYRNAAANLQKFVVESDKLLDRSVKAGAAISYAAPRTAEVVGTRAISAIEFLQSKIPKRPYEAVFPVGGPKPYTPSSLELAKFERYLQAVDSPLSVLDDLESGTVTREHVEALQKVYPALYTEIRSKVSEIMSDKSEDSLTYPKRVQLSLLFGLAGDASLLGKNIAALQMTFVPAEERGPGGSAVSTQTGSMVKPTVGGAKELDVASREASGVDSFLKRRQTGE